MNLVEPPYGGFGSIEEPRLNDEAMERIFGSFLRDNETEIPEIDANEDLFNQTARLFGEQAAWREEGGINDYVRGLLSQHGIPLTSQYGSGVEDGLGEQELDMLRQGPAGFYLAPQSRRGFERLMFGKKRAPFDQEMGLESPVGRDARRIFGERISETPSFQSFLESGKVPEGSSIDLPLAYAIEMAARYTDQQQGVGRPIGITHDESEAFRRAMREAGIEWLGYGDQKPFGSPTLQYQTGRQIGDLRGMPEGMEDMRVPQGGHRVVLPENWYEDQGFADYYEDLEQCEHCGEAIPDGEAVDSRYGPTCADCAAEGFCSACDNPEPYCEC